MYCKLLALASSTTFAGEKEAAMAKITALYSKYGKKITESPDEEAFKMEWFKSQVPFYFEDLRFSETYCPLNLQYHLWFLEERCEREKAEWIKYPSACKYIQKIENWAKEYYKIQRRKNDLLHENDYIFVDISLVHFITGSMPTWDKNTHSYRYLSSEELLKYCIEEFEKDKQKCLDRIKSGAYDYVYEKECDYESTQEN